MKRAVETQFYRLVKSVRLWLCIVGLAVFCLAVSWYSVSEHNTVVNVFSVMTLLNGFDMAFVVFATVPFSAAFCQDWNSGYIRFAVGRTGLFRYTVSLYLVGCFSAYITMTLGLVFYLLILSGQMPLTDVGRETGGDWAYIQLHGVYGQLLANGNGGGFLFFRIQSLSLVSMLYAGLGMTMSALMPNAMMTITIASFAKIILEGISVVFPAFPQLLDINRITQCVPVFDSLLWNSLYEVFLIGVILLFSYQLFAFWVQRRMENEVC